MILVDTTILVYALGTDHPLRGPCREIVAAVGDGRLRATTTVDVIQEFAHVRARRSGRADAASVASRYAVLFAPLIAVDADDLTDGLRLFRDHERLGSFDAVLAAASLRREHLTGVLSADGAFASVEGLVHIHPAHPDYRRELDI